MLTTEGVITKDGGNPWGLERRISRRKAVITIITRSATSIAVVVLVLCAAPAMAYFAQYTGSLTSAGGGLVGGGGWETGSSFGWTVTQENQGGIWQYDYSLTVPRKDASHFIVELTSDLKPDEIALLNLKYWDGTVWKSWTPTEMEIRTFYSNESCNPGMPEYPDGSLSHIYGIKLDLPDVPATNLQWSFQSRRNPVWGDFYAKDGRSGEPFAYLYNVGFLDPDPNPSSPDGLPVSGNQDPPGKGKILRPDGGGNDGEEITPELSPGALLLLGAVPVGIAWRRRKRCDN
ncbi:MAG: PEP-CTERM sorting domain-containing protein [Armatimonadetes bacterium]|nr:PEP-CTERM sorting domain-containing protein [Armatimonadota bacterium]